MAYIRAKQIFVTVFQETADGIFLVSLSSQLEPQPQAQAQAW